MAGSFALNLILDLAVFEQDTVSQNMGSCSDPKPCLGGIVIQSTTE